MTRVVKFCAAAAVCALAVAVGCSKQTPSPSAPGAADPASIDANADGSTLKASTPTLQSPINGVKLPSGEPVVLVAGNSTTSFVSGVPLSYRFEVTNAAGVVVETALVTGGSTTTSRTVAAELDGDLTYQWRVRPEYQGTPGPWSARASFISPTTDGYIRGAELYDPLINGKTVGTIVGPVTFIPGVGVRLEALHSYIVYELPQRVEDGQISALTTNMVTNSEGGKTKVFSMAGGYSDVTTNEARMTVEKRGDAPPGAIAWRFITTGSQIDTEGAERVVREFEAHKTYFWEATWQNRFFNLRVNEDGVTGRNIYEFGKPYKGFYNPVPHVVYVGSGPTRGGPDTQSVQGMVLRQLWVSERPRPAFANK